MRALATHSCMRPHATCGYLNARALQVKVLQYLQLFPSPEDPALRGRLNDILTNIIAHTVVTKSVNKNNGDHAILFEAVNLVIKHSTESKDAAQVRLRQEAIKHLGRFINIREPNIRYLGLETMSRIAQAEGTSDDIKAHQASIFVSLKDADVSIRRRALDLLFAMCDKTNVVDIVKELLLNLIVTDLVMKEEMVLKIAILAERFAPDMKWYIDTVLQVRAWR